ncbi:MAG: hypothetical protein ACQERF_09040, partial [Actinomycetota bacterium]
MPPPPYTSIPLVYGGGGIDAIEMASSLARNPRGVAAAVRGMLDLSGVSRLSAGDAARLSDDLRAPGGGFTVSHRTGEPVTEGFAVGVRPDRNVNLGVEKTSPEVVQRYADRNLDVLDQPGHHVGGWNLGERADLDLSRVFDNEEDALRLARDLGEEAIYDLGRQMTIPTGAGPRDVIQTAIHEASGLPPSVAGHPRFEAIRRDVRALESLGFDPMTWERSGSGMILPTPKNKAGQQTYDEVYSRVMGNKDFIIRTARRGEELGGLRWYDNQQILDLTGEAISDPVDARAAFDFLMEIEGVASAGSSVPNQTARASYLWYKLANGIPPSQITKADLPTGTGAMTWTSAQVPAFRRMDSGARPFSNEALKSGNYSGNLAGMADPVTADRWVPRIMENRVADATIGPPKGVSYTAYADASAEIARELGWNPRDFQAAIWVGAEMIDNPDAFRQVFMNGIHRVAREQSIPPAEAMRRFYEGDIHVNHLIGPDAAADLRLRAARVLAKVSEEPESEEDLLELIGLGGM